jgi:hypothetical protein
VPTIGGTFDSTGSAGSSVARPVARHGTPLLRGAVRLGTLGLAAPEDEVQYHVYANTEGSNSINYGSSVATVLDTTWMSGTLAAPGIWKFGVRAFNANGEEQNLDCAVTIVIDANGNDITNVPLAPTGLRAFATAGGGIRVEWWYPTTTGRRAPTGFHVYVGLTIGTSHLNSGFNLSALNVVPFNSSIGDLSVNTGTPNYAVPAGTVLYSAGLFNTFQVNLAGLSDGTQYTIGARAYNASGEEQNTAVVTVTADATGPAAVSSLTATAII